jgi:hypothetical protein
LRSMSKEAKLAELRAKTDVELARYVIRELNRAVRLASESNDQSRIGADETYAEVARLLPIAHGMDQLERRRLEAKLKRLREMLDQMAALTA